MSTQHPWHQVSPGENIPEIVNAVIEIPKGQRRNMKLTKNRAC